MSCYSDLTVFFLDPITSPAQTIGCTLDTEGNWTSLNLNGTITARTHDAQNKLTAIGSSTLSYDAGGYQTVDENGHALSYDAWGHLMVSVPRIPLLRWATT